jgi:hypothetical protein
VTGPGVVARSRCAMSDTDVVRVFEVRVTGVLVGQHFVDYLAGPGAETFELPGTGEAVFPQGLDDALKLFRWLLERSEKHFSIEARSMSRTQLLSGGHVLNRERDMLEMDISAEGANEMERQRLARRGEL